MKQITLIFILFFHLVLQINAQKRDEGKLRLAIINPEFAISASSLFSIYCKGELIYESEIDNNHLQQTYEKAHIDKILKGEKTYTIVLEGILKVPIIITNLVIHKRKMSFLQIDCKFISRVNTNSKPYLIIDYEKNRDKFYRDHPLRSCDMKME